MMVTLWTGSWWPISEPDQGVAGLVDRGVPLLLVADDHRAALGAHVDLVLGHLEVDHRDRFLVLAGGEQRGLVDEVLEVRAGEAGGAAGDGLEVDVGGERDALDVHAQDPLASAHVGAVDRDAAVEAAGPEDGRVEDVGAVGRRHDDDPLVGLEAVHLDEQLVQRLLALVVAAAEPCAAVPADGVDLVDEDDARRVLLALLEEVAHAAGADADEHLDEVRAGDAEERHARLARDGAGEQRLAGAGRPDHEHALGDAPAEALELLGILQERDDLLDLVLGLVDAGDVRERHLVLRVAEHPRLALAEAHGLAAAGLDLAHEQEEHDPDEDHREEGHDGGRPERGGLVLLEVDLRGRGVLDVWPGLQRGQERLVGDGAHGFVDERLLRPVRRVERERVVVVLDVDVLDLPLLHLLDELAERHGWLAVAALQHLPDREEHHDEQGPEKERLVRLLHVDLETPTTVSAERALARNGGEAEALSPHRMMRTIERRFLPPNHGESVRT